MKQLIIISILSIILYRCSPKHSVTMESYPNGKKKVEFVYKNENDRRGDKLINGQRLLYDSLGKLAQRDDYVDGKLNGKEVWYYPNGKIWMITKLRNDSAYGFEYEFNENGDTLSANAHYGLSVEGIFYKKWLPNRLTLTGSYGDSDRTYVIWKWMDQNGNEVKQKIDSGSLGDSGYKNFFAQSNVWVSAGVRISHHYLAESTMKNKSKLKINYLP